MVRIVRRNDTFFGYLGAGLIQVGRYPQRTIQTQLYGPIP